MISNSFTIVIGEDPTITGPSTVASEFKRASVAVFAANPRHIALDTRDDGFSLFIGETHSDEALTARPAGGTSFSYNDLRQTLAVECDRLGTGIVFWKRAGNHVLFSNRLENLVDAGSEPDWSSIQQYLHTGFTVGDTTFFRDVYQTLPNQRIEVEVTGSSVSLSASDRGIHSVDITHPDALIDQISAELSATLKAVHPSILMMSAGWDSRTLLLESEAGIRGAYSHGDLSSREVGLARKLSGGQRMDHLFADVRSAPITNALVDEMLEQLGFGIFPIWFAGARNVQQWKDAPIMSGVLGELLGGHYGIMSWGSRQQKLLSSVALISDSFIGEDRIRSIAEDYSTPPMTHWFVSDKGQEMLDKHRGETRQRSLDAIEACYKETGMWQRALEDFNMAHRARQYILKQPQTASSTVGYTIPFSSERLTDLVRALDFSYRVHNKTNRRILQSRRPSLLNAPMAATLVHAKYPVLLQEVSRAARVLSENAMSMLGRKPPRLGWFNFEHLYDTDILHEMADSLSSPIWDKPKMHQTLRNNPGNKVDAGATLDMICKIKTVDHHLRTIS